MSKIKKEITILRPEIPNVLGDLDMTKPIEDEDFFSLGRISKSYVEEQRADRVLFEKIIFKNVVFTDSTFENIELTDVRFINCDLSNINLRGAIVHRVEFIDCKMIGAGFIEGTFRNVLFSNCNLNYTNFRFSDLKQVGFSQCLLNRSDFQNAKFTKVEFLENNMKQIQLSGVPLKGIDFSTCDIEGIGVRVEDLYGAVIERDQAIEFTGLLGLKMKE